MACLNLRLGVFRLRRRLSEPLLASIACVNQSERVGFAKTNSLSGYWTCARRNGITGKETAWSLGQRWYPGIELPKAKRSIPELLKAFKSVVANVNVEDGPKDKIAKDAFILSDHLSPSDVASLLESCAEGNYCKKILLEAIATRIKDQDNFLRKCTFKDMGMIFYNFATLWSNNVSNIPFFQGFDGAMNAMVSAALAGVQSNYDLGCDLSIMHVIHGLGEIYQPRGWFRHTQQVSLLVDALLDCIIVEERLSACEPRIIANILYGCGNMGHQNLGSYEVLSHEFEMRIVDQYKQNKSVESKSKFGFDDMAKCIWGLGKVKYFNESLCETVADVLTPKIEDIRGVVLANTIRGFGYFPYRHIEFLRATCRVISDPARLAGLMRRELSDLTHGLGHLKFKNQKAIKVLCKEIRKPSRLASFTIDELCDVLAGIALLPKPHFVLVYALAEELQEESRISVARIQHLVAIVHAFGLLRYTALGEMRYLSNALRKPSTLVSYTNEDLMLIMVGLGQAKCENWDLLGDLVREIRSRERLEGYCTQHLVSFWGAFANLRYVQKETVNELAKKTRMHAGKMSQCELANVLCAFGKLGYNNKETLEVVVNEMCGRMDGLEDDDRQKVLEALDTLKVQDERIGQLLSNGCNGQGLS